MNQRTSFGKQSTDGKSWADLVFLTRMKRDDERKWQSARSWLGGSPTIHLERWPRSSTSGLPLHHLAQVNLADVPRAANTPLVPRAGVLNFFADTGLEGRDVDVSVVFSDERPGMAASGPPADCPPLGGGNWFYQCKGAATEAEAARLFRRWPIEFVLLPSSGRAYPNAREALAHLGPKPESIHIFKRGGLPEFQSAAFPWETVRRIVDDFRHTLNQHAARRQFYP
jgi:hypothetical protein